MTARWDKRALIGAAIAAGWRAAGSLPAAVADAALRAGGEMLYRRAGGSVVQLASNLYRVLRHSATATGRELTAADLAAATRAGVRSYARYWSETCRLESTDTDAVYRTALLTTSGLEHVERARAQGRGVVLALPHSGNWDVAGLTVCRSFGAMTTVAERIEPAQLFDRFVQYRTSLGMEVLPLTGGASPVSGVLKQRLSAGGIVCLLADRDLTSSGVPVSFFGAPARMPAGPAMLAALTGADLCTVQLSYTDSGWQQEVGPPIPLAGTRLRDKVAAGTQAMADRFAADIAAHPADWHMMQPLWSADLGPGAAAARGEAGTTR